jgi:hypothetical protein
MKGNAKQCKKCERRVHPHCAKQGLCNSCFHVVGAANSKKKDKENKAAASPAPTPAPVPAAAAVAAPVVVPPQPLLGIEYLAANAGSSIWPITLLDGCLKYLHDRRSEFPHPMEHVEHGDLTKYLFDIRTGNCDSTKSRLAAVHSKGNATTEDHYATLISEKGMPSRLYVADSFGQGMSVHPGLEDALLGHGVSASEVTVIQRGGAKLSQGLSCPQCVIANYASCLMNNDLSDEPTLTGPDFVSGEAFVSGVDRLVARAQQSKPAARLTDEWIDNHWAGELQDEPDAMPATAGLPPEPKTDDVPIVETVAASVPVQGAHERPLMVPFMPNPDRDLGPKAPPPPKRPTPAWATAKNVTRPTGPPPGNLKPAPPPPPPPPPPKTAAKDDGQDAGKKKSYQRAANDKILPIEKMQGVETPADFPKGQFGLRLTPMDEEAAKKKSGNLELQRLLQLKIVILSDLPKTAREGISDEQRRRHLYSLKDALNWIRNCEEDHHDLNLAAWIILALEGLTADRSWAPPTTSTAAATIYGCLERLDQYTNLDSIALVGSSVWRDAMKKWIKNTCGHSPLLGEMTSEAMEEILKPGATTLGAAVLLLLCWSTTGRPWNWLYVKRSDLRLSKSTTKGGYSLQVTWRDHKTVGKRGAFTTSSWMPKEWGEKVERWLSSVRGDYIFPKSKWKSLKEETKKAIKSQNPEWDLKSLRRGSLSTMARAGVPLSTLRQFSGHKSDAMLLRYLGWGIHAGEQKMLGEAAAQKLHA